MNDQNNNWKALGNYFRETQNPFITDLFHQAIFPWSPLEKLVDHITSLFENLENKGDIPAKKTVLRHQNQSLLEGAYFVNETSILAEDFIDSELRILIKKGTFLEAGATIKNHTVIEEKCEIRQGAYLRGFCYIGQNCVVGHTSEIKHSVFIRHVEAGHFAYIGNSIIGSFVNLGAGTKISNLQFRNFDDKKRIHFPEIPFNIQGKKIDTGLAKFGAVIGDGCETGCNSVLSPFVFLEPECWIMPNVNVLKGVYPKGCMIKNLQDCKKYNK
ncbi:MAG: hypothetical protein OEY59_11880 [Deltaproteobacteria bacterium]|nr:hypothetical protein [Deltaproteobacteria bacterium]